MPVTTLASRDTTAPWAAPTESFAPPPNGWSAGPGGPRSPRPRSAVVGLVVLLSVLIIGLSAYLVTHGKAASTGARTAPPAHGGTATTATAASRGAVGAPTTTQPPQPSTTTTIAAPAAVDTTAVSASPLAGAVSQTLATYFGGINNRDFAQAYAVLSPANQFRLSYAAFVRGSETSMDSAIAVQSVDTSGGNPVATVNFTSHQNQSGGPNPGETCTNWSLLYHLVPATAGAAVSWLIDAVTLVGPGHAAC